MSDQVFIESRICDFELPPQGTKKFYLLRTCMIVAIKYQGANHPVRALITDFTPNEAVKDNFSSDQPLLFTHYKVPANFLLQARWKVSTEFSEFLKSFHKHNEENLRLTGSFTNASGDFIFVKLKLSVKDYRGSIDGDIESLELIPKDDLDPNDEVIQRYFKLAGKDLLNHTEVLKQKISREIYQRYTAGDYNLTEKINPIRANQRESQIGSRYSHRIDNLANIYTQASSPIPDDSNEDYTNSKRRLDYYQQDSNTKRQRITVSNTISFKKLNEINILDDSIYTVSGFLTGITPNITACQKTNDGKLNLAPVKLYFNETNSSDTPKDEEESLVISFDTEFEILSFYSVRHIEEVFVYETYFGEKINDILRINDGIPMNLKIQRKKIKKGIHKFGKVTFFSLGWNCLNDLNVNSLMDTSL